MIHRLMERRKKEIKTGIIHRLVERRKKEKKRA